MAASSTQRDVVRVTVRVDGLNIDLSLPNKVPVGELAVDVAKECAPLMEGAGVDPEWLRKPTSEIILSPSVGTQWKPTTTLDRAGIHDGDFVVLSTRDRNERYPALVEVMQDATANIRDGAFAPWELATSLSFASKALPLIMGILSVAASLVFLNVGSVAVGCIMLALAAGAVALSLVLDSAEEVHPDIVSSLNASSYVPAACGTFLVIPGGFNQWSLIAGCCTGLVLAIVLTVFKRPSSSVNMGFATAFGVILAGLGIASAIDSWRDMPPWVMAACIVTVALMVMYFEPSLSRVVSRLELPFLPLDTEDGERVADAEITEIMKMLSENSSWESLINQRDRNIEARNVGIGICSGTAVALALGCIASVVVVPDGKVTYLWPEFDSRSVLIFHLLLCCLLFVLQGSWYRDRALRGVALTGGTASMLLTLFVMGLRSNSWGEVRLGIAVAIVFTVCVIAIAVAWRGKPSRSLRLKQWGERVESLLYVFPLVNIAALINIFFLIRHR